MLDRKCTKSYYSNQKVHVKSFCTYLRFVKSEIVASFKFLVNIRGLHTQVYCSVISRTV